MVTEIRFGEKYMGRLLEKIALIDYPFLDFIKENMTLYGNFKEKLDEIMHILNHYLPYVNCESCGEVAKNIATPYELTHQHKRDYSILASSFYCNEPDCVDPIKEIRSEINPIKYETIIQIPKFPRDFREHLHTLLQKTIGFDGKRLTDKKAEKLIYNLKKHRLTKPLAQSSLFEIL